MRFISDEELRLLGGDAADQIRDLIEQRHARISAEFCRSLTEASEVTAAAERRAAELASSLRGEIHQLRFQSSQSLALIEKKVAEIKEKDDIIQSYYDKIATIYTVHTTEEVQENERSMERRNHEEHIKRLERVWAELRKEPNNNSWRAASDAESRAASVEIDHLSQSYSNEELEDILSHYFENPDLPSNIHRINFYDKPLQEIKQYVQNGIAYIVTELTHAKKGGKAGVRGYNRTMKCKRRWIENSAGNFDTVKSKVREFKLQEKDHDTKKMLEFTLIHGPKDLVLCKVIWNCDSKIRKQSYKEDVEDEECKEVLAPATSSTKEELLEKHKELKTNLPELTNMDKEAWMSTRIAQLEREISESSNSLRQAKERIFELEQRVSYMEKDKELLEKHNLRLDEELREKEKNSARIAQEKKDLIEKIMEVEFKLKETEKELSKAEDLRRYLYNQIMMLKGNMRVFCRVRPLASNSNISDTEKTIIFPQSLELAGRGIELVQNGTVVSYTFDRVFDDTVSQQTIYDEISELVQSSMDGYKVTIFSYGQTGSGKTYTMIGKPDDKGMIPRALTEIFNKIKVCVDWSFSVEASMVEIYNEQIIDLLDTNSKKANVPGFGQQPVRDENDAIRLFEKASSNRCTKKTQMNDKSSRSHFILKLIISGYNKKSGHKTEGVLQMIDLAGSESVSKTTDVMDVQITETGNINKSLLALGRLFEAISKGGFLPFRGYKLTHLLQNSFEGQSKVLLFVNISQDPASFHSTLESLKFADKVHKCMIKVPAMQDKSMVHEQNGGHDCSKSYFKPKASGQKGQGVGKFGTSLKPPNKNSLHRG